MRRLAALLAFLLFAALAAFSPSPVLHAQEAVAADAPDYAAWESVATRGEAALEEGRASDDALAALRAELVEWRARFVAAQETNADRIETVRSQIEALGPLPAEGETETEEVAARRADLGDLLTELQAPARRASEAFSRAEGLIREIDAIIRDRQTEALLERETSPLNPSVWPAALSQLRATFSGALSELTTNWANPVRQATLRNDLPITLALLIVAVVMLIRGRIWMERLTASIFQRFGSRVAGFFISTGQVIVPTIGILLLTRALDSTGLLGLRGGVLLRALPVLVLSFFLARWIGERVFPKVGAALLDGDVPPEVRARFRWFAGAIGLTIGLRAVFAILAEQETYAPEVEAAVLFPFTVILGLLLFRLGRSLFALSRDIRDHESVGILGSSAITFLSRAAMVLGVLGPLLGAAGYLARRRGSPSFRPR
jgi:potassium efflux system protein